MGLTRQLTPQLVERYLNDVEIFLRTTMFPPPVVEDVFRFGGHVASHIDSHHHLERGMDLARAQIASCEKKGHSFPSGTIILAGSLTKGKGRFARRWHAPHGGIWLTLVMANTLLPRYAHFVPLAAGVSCGEALASIGVDCRLKWVNDVHVEEKKIAGVLTENFRSPLYGEEYILLGIGINVNNDSFPPELEASSVSVCQILGKEVDLLDLSLRLLAKLVWNIGLLHYEERQDLSEGEGARSNLLLNRWKQMSDSVGRRVLYGFDVQKNPLFEAKVLDIDEEGRLVMRILGKDEVISEQSGEIVYLNS